MRILLVEDEPRLASLIQQGLTEEGYAVDAVRTGEDALAWLLSGVYDAVILDVMLPGISGFAVCQSARGKGDTVPILLLTALGSIEDRVMGLDAGADDYLVKPFALAELTARLRALLRRPPAVTEVILTCGWIQLDPARKRVWSHSLSVELGAREFSILEYLMRNADRVLTRAMITNHVWNSDIPNSTNVIDVHIRALRHKLDIPLPDSPIETIRGVGYRIRSDAT